MHSMLNITITPTFTESLLSFGLFLNEYMPYFTSKKITTKLSYDGMSKQTMLFYVQGKNGTRK